MKLGLGTVQFGLDYGISNSAGRTPPGEVRAILQLAAAEGVRLLDTAPGYGSSEETLGACLSEDGQFSIVTKTPAFQTDSIRATDIARMRESFRSSLRVLRPTRVYGLLVHRAQNLLNAGGGAMLDSMLELKQAGLVEKIGVSVYDGEEIDAVLGRYAIDLVQLPLNVLDQRLLAGGHLRELKRRGVEIHARSAFLQGVLLSPPDILPAHFDPVREHLRHYLGELRQREISPLQAALGFVMGIEEVDYVICGVNSRVHLREICNAAKIGPVDIDYRRFAIDDDTILNPALWRTQA